MSSPILYSRLLGERETGGNKVDPARDVIIAAAADVLERAREVCVAVDQVPNPGHPSEDAPGEVSVYV